MTPQPRFHLGAALTRLALSALFLSIPRLFIRVVASQLDRDVGAPRTIYAMTHKRDPDTFLAPALLLRHRGWRALTIDVRFVMRADAFRSGFLTRVVPRPEWLRRALRPFSVGWVLRWAGVYPIDGFHSRPAELWIREALAEVGDMPAGKLLASTSLGALAQSTGTTADTLAKLDARTLTRWRYATALQSPSGASLFVDPERRRAERRLMAVARAELAATTDWLRAGGSLFLAPEGRLTPDGLLSPARAGLRLLTREAPPGTRIQPISITYDFMCVGRLRMWIDLASPITDLASLSGGQIDRQLRAAWLTALRMTTSQLATAALVDWRVKAPDDASVTGTIEDLARDVRQLAQALTDAGRRVDSELLSAASARRRVQDYLRYAAYHGLVRRKGKTFTVTQGALPEHNDAPAMLPGVPPDGVGYDRYPMRYAWNEAFTVLSDAGLLGSSRNITPTSATPFMADAGL
jgi:1-acyl-sn-glycerol-3-phosphate acyltransferase